MLLYTLSPIKYHPRDKAGVAYEFYLRFFKCSYFKNSSKFFLFPKNSGIEKAFLFDVVSKIYIATDSSPVDMQSYELCCEMIDVVIDVSCIYG